MDHRDNNVKEPTTKNRQFIAKVSNINKIHEQINEMLKIVKSGESKSVVKYKQSSQDKYQVKNDDNIDKIIKQRLR